ncbi:MAG: IS30 family transposase, partial [Bacillota bacterium]
KEVIFRMPNRKAESVVRCLNILERRYGKLFRKVFKTITVDNGSEFFDFDGLEKSSFRGKRVRVYYCHPYTSSERGSNERLNREIRRLIPKGSDLSKFTDEEIKAVEDWVNAYPREIFDYATSAEQYAEQIAALA